jgi:glycosyltransferase involved in cell wall biosynthesis
MCVKIYHFYNGSGGGVWSVIKNLVQFSDSIKVENHIVHAINNVLHPKYEMELLNEASSQQLYRYSPNNNFYYTCKQLAKLLPNDKAVVVAHDWLELGMMSNLGLQNPVVHFLHADLEYYYNLAIKHQNFVDRFIAVSPVISKKLCEAVSYRTEDIHFCRFPVPAVTASNNKNKILKLFYCVRDILEERKQFKLLGLINKCLQQKKLLVSWSIIGAGLSLQEVKEALNQEQEIFYNSSLPNEKVISLMPKHDIFILPSLKEGFPVAVVEAMKGGLVPLVTNWDEATKELIIENETGYYFKIGDAQAYAETIIRLDADRIKLQQMANAASKKANELFDPNINTRQIENIMTQAAEKVSQTKKTFKAYGSRLDEPWIPNVVTKTIRGLH